MKKILLVFFTLLSIPIFSQDYSNLYKDYIPEKILNDNVLSKTLDLNLQRNALLNPELIYLTLKFYEQYDKNNLDPELFENLKSNERIWLVRRSDWANNVLNKIMLTGKHELIYETEKPLRSLALDINLKDSDRLMELDDTEKKLRDFFVVKLYKNAPELVFDANIDYGLLRLQLEEGKRQYFIDLQNNPRRISSSEEIVNSVINQWYLFDNNKISAAELLNSSLENMITDKTRKRFSFFAGNAFINNTVKFSETISFSGINYEVNLDDKVLFPQYTFGMGYKLYFQKESFLLSYLDIQAEYSRAYTEVSRSKRVMYSYTTFDGSYETQEYLRNFDDSYKLTSLISYGLKVSVPLVEWEFLSFEIGGGFYFNNYQYEPDMYFIYSKYRTEYNSDGQPIYRETLLSGSTTINQKVKKEYFSFIPTIDVNLDILLGFGIKISGSYNYLALNAFYKTALFF